MPLSINLPSRRDPLWGLEGRAARRRRWRTTVESGVALSLAITACGLTAAVWIRALDPLWRQLGLG